MASRMHQTHHIVQAGLACWCQMSEISKHDCGSRLELGGKGECETIDAV